MYIFARCHWIDGNVPWSERQGLMDSFNTGSIGDAFVNCAYVLRCALQCMLQCVAGFNTGSIDDAFVSCICVASVLQCIATRLYRRCLCELHICVAVCVAVCCGLEYWLYRRCLCRLHLCCSVCCSVLQQGSIDNASIRPNSRVVRAAVCCSVLQCVAGPIKHVYVSCRYLSMQDLTLFDDGRAFFENFM